MTTFLLPYPPSWNRLYRIARNRFYKHRDYVEWQRWATIAVTDQVMPRRFDGAVKVTCRVGRPDRRKRDLDNAIKAVGDLLPLLGFIENDHQIHHWDVAWDERNKNGVLVIIDRMHDL